MNSSKSHDNIREFIPKKCHLESYDSDINYHMTLNIVFSVAPSKGEHLQWAWTSLLAPISPKIKPLDSHMVG